METYLAFALVVGFALKFTYTLGALYSLLLWLVPEHFGTPYAPGTAYVGTAIIYTFVFLALLVPRAGKGPSPHSVDAPLERRVPWWHRLADA